MLVCAVKKDLAAVARAVEAVDRREDGSEIELPAALKEICNLVEKQLCMSPVDTHLLGTKTASFADGSHGASDRPQRRHREIGCLDDGVDVTRRLFYRDAGRGFGRSQPAGDFAQNLLLTFAVHRLLRIAVELQHDVRASAITLPDCRRVASVRRARGPACATSENMPSHSDLLFRACVRLAEQ